MEAHAGAGPFHHPEISSLSSLLSAGETHFYGRETKKESGDTGIKPWVIKRTNTFHSTLTSKLLKVHTFSFLLDKIPFQEEEGHHFFAFLSRGRGFLPFRCLRGQTCESHQKCSDACVLPAGRKGISEAPLTPQWKHSSLGVSFILNPVYKHSLITGECLSACVISRFPKSNSS